MVVKLVGEIDGQEIVFEHKEGDMWTTTIPKIKSGMYIISLSAYDDAGNVGFATKYIVTIDTTMLKVSLEPYPTIIQTLACLTITAIYGYRIISVV